MNGRTFKTAVMNAALMCLLNISTYSFASTPHDAKLGCMMCHRVVAPVTKEVIHKKRPVKKEAVRDRARVRLRR